MAFVLVGWAFCFDYTRAVLMDCAKCKATLEVMSPYALPLRTDRVICKAIAKPCPKRLLTVPVLALGGAWRCDLARES